MAAKIIVGPCGLPKAGDDQQNLPWMKLSLRLWREQNVANCKECNGPMVRTMPAVVVYLSESQLPVLGSMFLAGPPLGRRPGKSTRLGTAHLSRLAAAHEFRHTCGPPEEICR